MMERVERKREGGISKKLTRQCDRGDYNSSEWELRLRLKYVTYKHIMP